MSVGSDTFTGVARVRGSNQGDTISGNAGDNILEGLDGNDLIDGRAGADTLNGGGGDDVFRYTGTSTAEFTAQGGDRISDFADASGDLIDVSSLAASAEGGAWTFVGNAAFNGGNTTGEVRYQLSGPDTLVQFDHNGDGAADASITLTGVHTLTSNEFDLLV